MVDHKDKRLLHSTIKLKVITVLSTPKKPRTTSKNFVESCKTNLTIEKTSKLHKNKIIKGLVEPY